MQLVLGAPGTLGYALSALLVTVLALAPGLPLALGLGRRSRWDLPTVLAASFALQLGAVGAAAAVAYFTGGTLVFAAVAGEGALLAGGLLSLRPLRGTRLPRDAGVPALVIGGACVALGVFERTWFSHMADAFYHLAAVRSLVATGRPLVTDPLFGTSAEALDATAGAWHTLLAVWARATGLDVATWLWPGATAVGAALTLVALWALAREVSASKAAATVAAVAFLVAGLTADVRWSAYPNRLSLALALVALGALARLAGRPSWPDAALAAVAGFATAATHLAAGAMVAVAGALLLALAAAVALLRRDRAAVAAWTPSAALLAAGLAAAALAAPLVLPKAGVVRASWLVGFHAERIAAGLVALPGGLLVDVPGHLMKAPWPLFAFGAVVAVAAGIRAFRTADAGALAVAAFAGLPLVLLLDPPVTTALLRQSFYLTQRVAILLPFTVFLALAWAVGAALREGRDRRRVLAAATALAALATLSAAGAAATSWGAERSVLVSRASDVRLTWGRETDALLSAELDARYPRVATDPETGYYLAGVAPASVCAVTSQHTPLAFEARDGQARRDDMRALMSRGTPEAVRRAIVARWDADYVLVPKYRGGYGAALAEMRTEQALLRPVFETDTLALFAVVR